MAWPWFGLVSALELAYLGRIGGMIRAMARTTFGLLARALLPRY